MAQTTRVAPMNSIVFVEDQGGGEGPEPVWGASILATDSCISVACFPEVDGETTIVLGRVDEVDTGRKADFVGSIRTGKRNLVITMVDGTVILQSIVPRTTTTIHIWRSHPRWPEEVVIGWS